MPGGMKGNTCISLYRCTLVLFVLEVSQLRDTYLSGEEWEVRASTSSQLMQHSSTFYYYCCCYMLMAVGNHFYSSNSKEEATMLHRPQCIRAKTAVYKTQTALTGSSRRCHIAFEW